MKHKLLTTLLLILVGCPLAWAQDADEQMEAPPTDSTVIKLAPPAPVASVEAEDTENDHGHAITLTWGLSADDAAGDSTVISYEVFRWYPAGMDETNSLRDRLSGARGTARAFRAGIQSAEIAMRELAKDPGKLGSLPFQVAIPDDSTFELTVAYVEQKLQDTIATMVRMLPDLKGSIRPLISEMEDAIDKLPGDHAAYPNNGEWRSVGIVASGITTYSDVGSKEIMAPDYSPDHTDMYYRVEAVTADVSVRSEGVIVGPVQSYGQWFNIGRLPTFIFAVGFLILTVSFVAAARKGADLYVRPLAGIEAVDDAIGRATEMGKPILYVLGLGTADMVATIASFTILGRVAKRVAEYQTRLIVPCYDPIVMAVAQEVVKSSYLDAGRPDDYDEDSVYFVTNMQFAYVAAVNGIMLREHPATNMYMGKFFAESLLLAETGSLAGSIQIAGTDEIAQIPFFIVACDYTLIGEELYAASAYLGREPILLGSLKAQDWAKAAIVVLSLIGLISIMLGYPQVAEALKVTN